MQNAKNQNIDFKKEFNRINEKLNKIVEHHQSKQKETWVKVVVIQKLTGWDKEWLRVARKSKLVEFRKNGNLLEYLLESIHPSFIKHDTKNFENNSKT